MKVFGKAADLVLVPVKVAGALVDEGTGVIVSGVKGVKDVLKSGTGGVDRVLSRAGRNLNAVVGFHGGKRNKNKTQKNKNKRNKNKTNKNKNKNKTNKNKNKNKNKTNKNKNNRH
jgi:hypothetical protein